jgi:hypothetical protein
MNDTLSLIDFGVRIITGLLGIIIAYLIYQLNKRQQGETWVNAYRQIHETFWNDPIMARVRCWINYDRAYLEIKPILQKRKEIDDGKMSLDELSESEYKPLDDLDKFYNLALEVAAMNSHLKVRFEQEFWKQLYFDYWVSERINDKKRSELKWYVHRFYPELLDTKLPVGRVEKKRTYPIDDARLASR